QSREEPAIQIRAARVRNIVRTSARAENRETSHPSAARQSRLLGYECQPSLWLPLARLCILYSLELPNRNHPASPKALPPKERHLRSRVVWGSIIDNPCEVSVFSSDTKPMLKSFVVFASFTGSPTWMSRKVSNTSLDVKSLSLYHRQPNSLCRKS